MPIFCIASKKTSSMEVVYPANQQEFNTQVLDADIYAGRFITSDVFGSMYKA